jgi:hypothetical protein
VHEYTTGLRKMAIMLGISSKNPYALLKYLGGLDSHLKKKAMLLNLRIVNEDYVQE